MILEPQPRIRLLAGLLAADLRNLEVTSNRFTRIKTIYRYTEPQIDENK